MAARVVTLNFVSTLNSAFRSFRIFAVSVMADTLLFVFGLFDTGVLLFLTVYFVITLSDLECDYLNAQQCCSKLNGWVLPELIAHTVYVLLLLLFGFHWILFLVNMPMAAWQLYKYASIPMGNVGVYDPTEIHNRGMLKNHMKEAMVKLGYYLIFFFIYLYCMIVSLLTKEPSSYDAVDTISEDTDF